MIDLLYLTQSGDTLPSVRFRVLPFVADARARGLRVAVERFPKSALKRTAFYARLPRARIIIIQKKLVSKPELAVLKAKAGRLVYDFDDALWTSHPNQGPCSPERSARDVARLEKMCRAAHTVVAGNAFLAEKVREWVADDILIMPTPLDTDSYVPATGRSGAGELPTVGWMGTSCNLFFLPELFQALGPIAGHLTVRVVSDEAYPIPDGFDGAFELWSPERELAQLQAMDIGLMPLTDDEYTRGKCGFKLLQYMACGVVPVASDVGFNREIVTHGRDGFLAQTPGDFTRYVGELTADKTLRREMAERARRKVVEKFSLSAATNKLWDALELG